jgi:hypothetical protein
MKKVLLLLFFISSLHYSQGQIKEVSLVFKTNLAKLHYEYATPQVGFEIGTNLKFPLLKKFDLVMGGSFRFVRYGIFKENSDDWFNHSEQLFHFKIPLELSYKITPNRWRAHVGVWGSILLTASADADSDYIIITPQNEREFFSKVYSGANLGISHSFPNGFEVMADYSLSINSIYQKENKWYGLSILSFGILVPIKK